MDNFSRNKPRPNPPQEEQQQQPLAPLSELAGLAPDFAGTLPPALVTNAGKESRSRRHTRSHAHSNSSAPRHANVYESAPLPDGIEYPPSPLQQTAGGVMRGLPPVPVPIPVPISRSERMMMGEPQSSWSPLSNNDNVPPSSGFLGFGLKGRLPWRRNTAK
jgi:hypothetical protein